MRVPITRHYGKSETGRLEEKGGALLALLVGPWLAGRKDQSGHIMSNAMYWVSAAGVCVAGICVAARLRQARRHNEALLEFVSLALCDSLDCSEDMYDSSAVAIYPLCHPDASAPEVAIGAVNVRKLLPNARVLVLDLHNDTLRSPIANYSGPQVLRGCLSNHGLTEVSMLPFLHEYANSLTEVCATRGRSCPSFSTNRCRLIPITSCRSPSTGTSALLIV